MRYKSTLHKFLFIVPVLLFVTGIILERNELIPWANYSAKKIVEYDSLNVKVTKRIDDHNFVLLNDSIAVWGGAELIQSTSKERENTLKMRMLTTYKDSTIAPIFDIIYPPYDFVKLRGDSTIFYIISNGDTLKFRTSFVRDTDSLEW